ncbi:MAG: DUF6282 family protein [Actinomycetota bacterium]
MTGGDSPIPRGMIDCHLHHSPDVIPRRRTALELARSARVAGMGGIVIKSHHANTAGVAVQVQQLVPEVRVFGAVALNGAVGGLNPAAVRMSAKFGARVVWMPTTSAANHVSRLNDSTTMAALRADTRDEGISILDDRGRVLPVVGDVLGEVRSGGMTLATGHLSAEETLKLAEYASRGSFPMRRFVVTHCDMPFTFMDDDAQRYVSRLGGYLERVLMLFLSYVKKASPDALEPGAEYTGRSFYMPEWLDLDGLFARIRESGIEHNILSTDLGQAGNPDPVDGIAEACRLLLDCGFTRDELRQMAVTAPRRLLGVDD